MADNQANIDAIGDAVSSIKSDLDSAVGNLQAQAMATYTPAVTQVGFDNNPSWENIRGRDVTMPGLGDLPADRPNLIPPAFVFNPEDYLSADLLQRYSYESDFFDVFLDPRIRDYIDSQAYFLAQGVQDALFEVSRQRDLQILNDALDAIDRQQARRGFPIPTSIHAAARADVVKKYQDTYADRNKEITALIADKSLQEKMHAMDTGIKMEDIRSRFQLEFGRLYWQATDYLIKKYEADVRLAIADFEADLESVKLKANIDSKTSDTDLAYVRLDQEKELARLEATLAEMQGNIATWTKSVDMQVKAAESAIDYYSRTVLGWTGQANYVDIVDKT